jgi:peptidoglycan/LPS O-acetylase OafA/YrhL
VLARVVLSLLLLNEVWLMSVMSFSNLPFWSICVEFWYYAAFALVVFLPRRKGWVAAALLALALGPKFILLAPIWCSGVVLYRWRWPRRLGRWPSLALVALSLVGIWQFHAWGSTPGVASGSRPRWGRIGPSTSGLPTTWSATTCWPCWCA